MSVRRIFARPARFAVIAPYLWMVLFFLVPFGFVLKISLSQTAIAQPPYVPVFELTQGAAAIKAAFAALSLDNFRLLVSDDLYVLSYLRSLVVAGVSTSILLLIGYPIAYGMARLPRRWQSVAMMLVIVPFWTSFLIRIYAWINILQHDGLLNKILLALHLVSTPVVWLSTDSAMYLGIVYSYLPFMILPLYATLAKMDPALLEAAMLANATAGISVGKQGTATVSRQELLDALHLDDLVTTDRKVASLDDAIERVSDWHRRGLKVGFANGCFDLIHPGHVRLLSEARAACDRLIVALNTDASVKRLKGPSRPLQNEMARATVMASMSPVDLVTLFDEDTPLEMIRALRPDVLVKGSDYTVDQVVGAEDVQSWGGKVVLVTLREGHSTTGTIQRMTAPAET